MRFLNANNRFTLTSSNAPVENYPAWDSSTTYNKDDKVIYNNHIWTSLVDSNSSEPGTDVNWFDEGAINPYKCLDKYINTQTTGPTDSSLIMEFDVTNVNAVVLLNLEAVKVIVNAYDSNGDLIGTVEKSTITGITDWGDYFFGDITFNNKILIEGPQLLKGKITIELQGNPVKIGVVLIGFLEDLGITLQGVKSSIDDYSKKKVDDNGNVYLQEGNYADRFEGKVLLNLGDFNKVKQKLVSLRGQAYYYTATKEDICRELDVYGYYENFELDINNSVKAECNLTIRGLI